MYLEGPTDESQNVTEEANVGCHWETEGTRDFTADVSLNEWQSWTVLPLSPNAAVPRILRPQEENKSKYQF